MDSCLWSQYKQPKARGLCGWNCQSELCRKILSYKPKKEKKHTGQGVGMGEGWKVGGGYIKLLNLVLCSYLHTAFPTGMHPSRNASFTYSLLADITSLIWESLLLCAEPSTWGNSHMNHRNRIACWTHSRVYVNYNTIPAPASRDSLGVGTQLNTQWMNGSSTSWKAEYAE